MLHNPLLRQHLQKDTALATPPYAHLIQRGELIAGGASGIVELLPCGDAIKTPWNGDTGHLCRQEMILESQIYARLGCHPRLVRFISWDPDHYALTMEYMPNGSLKDYLARKGDVSTIQRLRWAREAAEGLQLLHSADVFTAMCRRRTSCLTHTSPLKLPTLVDLHSTPPIQQPADQSDLQRLAFLGEIHLRFRKICLP